MDQSNFEYVQLTEAYTKTAPSLRGVAYEFILGDSAECAFAKSEVDGGSVYSAYVVQGSGDGLAKYNDCIKSGGKPVSYKEYKENKIYNSEPPKNWTPNIGDEVYIPDVGVDESNILFNFMREDFVKVIAVTRVRHEVILTLNHGILGPIAIKNTGEIRPVDTSFRCWVRSHFR